MHKTNKTIKQVLATLLFIFGVSNANAQCGITFSVAPNDVLGINSVILSLDGTEDHVGFSVGIDWGDETAWSIGFEEDWVHTYSGPGTYEICVNFVGPDCIQADFCESYTITESPEHSELCPLTASYTLSGTELQVEATGSGAGTPSLSFHPDILSFIDDPLDFTDFQFISDHTGEFTYDYAPLPSPDATYIFCTSYYDLDEPEACEGNDYCASITFGAPTASIEDNSNFESMIQAYPVPASTYINVHFSEVNEVKDVAWKIIGLDGKEVVKGTLNTQLSTILLPTNMANGNYQLILSKDTKERTINFIKQ